MWARACIAGVTFLTFVVVSAAKGNADKDHMPRSDGLQVEHAEIVLPPPGGNSMAGYLAIWNGTERTADLVRVESEAFASVSVHQTQVLDGVAKMRSMDSARIPGHSELLMRPGGIHLMASSPTQNFTASAGVNLVLVFASGERIDTMATVLAPGTRPIDHHHGEGDRIESE